MTPDEVDRFIEWWLAQWVVKFALLDAQKAAAEVAPTVRDRD